MSLVQKNTTDRPRPAREASVKDACEALGISRSTYYRRLAKQKAAEAPEVAEATKTPPTPAAPRRPARRLSDDERAAILVLLCREAYADLSVRQVFAEELEAGRYHCSVRSMYRILAENQASRERRRQRRHPPRAKPRLTADGPNQVWTWDITKIPGPGKGRWFFLYVVIDLYSRRAVGWALHRHENAQHATELLETAAAAEGIEPGQLTLHADNGSPMISTDLAGLCQARGIARSFSRPRVSNDNPFSEAQFKTLKYHRDWPGRFESLAEAEAYLTPFFDWYNDEHHHQGIALFTPNQVHRGEHLAIDKVRQATLDAAFAANPERFVRGRPQPKALRLPETVSINPEVVSAEIKPTPKTRPTPAA